MFRSRGFSLIELVIVVVIIGILSAIALPRISRGSEGAGINAFVSEINTFAMLMDQYQIETGSMVADSATGVIPVELKDYLDANSWSGGTPLGGEWDVESNDSGVTLAVGVHYQNGFANIYGLKQVDTIIDDGDLTTGAFRFIGARRYYLVLQE
ncbi:MAG: prepilin-type N-terminal cleavage/methylation domain-containing protein [Planctomycetota bacterium]